MESPDGNCFSIATYLTFYVFDTSYFLYFYHCETRIQVDPYGAKSFGNKNQK